VQSASRTNRVADEVASLSWYQTIDLNGVTTPGMFDTIKGARRSLLPSGLSGKRCLDVAPSMSCSSAASCCTSDYGRGRVPLGSTRDFNTREKLRA
jgi:hypothetical protein